MLENNVLVVGGGHAGVEAALALSRMKVFCSIITLDKEAVGRLSCNPAIGGLGKGHLVKEIDALDGLMGVVADKSGIQNVSFKLFNDFILKDIPKEYLNYDTILGEPLFINQFRLSKFLKNNIKTMVKNPSLFLNKKKRTIKFHFDMMHGSNNLDKAIELLDNKEKNDFKNFVNTNVSFNPQNMLICKSKKILISYYESIFPWLERCENVFGFDDLKGYGLQRIYAFLAERYMSYWFQKYTKYKIMPIFFKDLTDYLEQEQNINENSE